MTTWMNEADRRITELERRLKALEDKYVGLLEELEEIDPSVTITRIDDIDSLSDDEAWDVIVADMAANRGITPQEMERELQEMAQAWERAVAKKKRWPTTARHAAQGRTPNCSCSGTCTPRHAGCALPARSPPTATSRRSGTTCTAPGGACGTANPARKGSR